MDDDGGQDFSAYLKYSSFKKCCFVRQEDGGGGILLEVKMREHLTELSWKQKVYLTLEQPEKNTAIFRLPKRIIKTLLTDDNAGASDSQITIRRQFVGTTNSSGVQFHFLEQMKHF